MRVILHITTRDDWEQARPGGWLHVASLDTEGFIHCSTPAQVVGTLNRFFRGQTDLVLLVIDADKLTSPIRYEAADGDRFPHLYGPLNMDAIVNVLPLALQADGTFGLPPGLEDAV